MGLIMDLIVFITAVLPFVVLLLVLVDGARSLRRIAGAQETAARSLARIEQRLEQSERRPEG